MNVWERWMVPNLDGQSWDILQIYFKECYGTGEDGVGTFLFDPKTDATTYCSPRVGLGPYTTIVCGGQLYLSGYAVQGIAPVLDGRRIAISSIRAADELNNNQAPESAKLFVYDVGEHRIVRKIVPLAMIGYLDLRRGSCLAAIDTGLVLEGLLSLEDTAHEDF